MLKVLKSVVFTLLITIFATIKLIKQKILYWFTSRKILKNMEFTA